MGLTKKSCMLLHRTRLIKINDFRHSASHWQLKISLSLPTNIKRIRLVTPFSLLSLSRKIYNWTNKFSLPPTGCFVRARAPSHDSVQCKFLFSDYASTRCGSERAANSVFTLRNVSCKSRDLRSKNKSGSCNRDSENPNIF